MGTDAGNMTHTIPYLVAISLSLFFHVFFWLYVLFNSFVLLVFKLLSRFQLLLMSRNVSSIIT